MDTIRSSSTAGQGSGGPPDAEILFGRFYAELRRVARRALARGGSDPSLGVATLLHDAYVDVSARHGAVFPDEAHFMGYAARVMRGLIVDQARALHAGSRGGDVELTSLKTDDLEITANPSELTAVSDALDDLAAFDSLLTEIVDLNFFCGLSFGEIAAMHGLSERSVKHKWDKARDYLFARLRGHAADLS